VRLGSCGPSALLNKPPDICCFVAAVVTGVVEWDASTASLGGGQFESGRCAQRGFAPAQSSVSIMPVFSVSAFSGLS
jgi:hypothetical protein